MNCLNCGIEFESKRADAKFCSPNCRVTFNRKQSIVTDNVTLSEPTVTDNFKYFSHGETKEAKYWYDVPLAGSPVKQKGWPDMPDYMNCRQYFLWWKNNFEVGKGKPPFDGAVIHNPFPVYDNVRYEKAGEGSRRWGV